MNSNKCKKRRLEKEFFCPIPTCIRHVNCFKYSKSYKKHIVECEFRFNVELDDDCQEFLESNLTTVKNNIINSDSNKRHKNTHLIEEYIDDIPLSELNISNQLTDKLIGEKYTKLIDKVKEEQEDELTNKYNNNKVQNDNTNENINRYISKIKEYKYKLSKSQKEYVSSNNNYINDIKNYKIEMNEKIKVLECERNKMLIENNEINQEDNYKKGLECYNTNNIDKATEYFMMNDKIEHSDSQFMLYLIYESKDINKAFIWLNKSLENNNSKSQLEIYKLFKELKTGYMNISNEQRIRKDIFNKTVNIELSLNNAIKYLQLSIKQNDSNGQYEFGKLNLYGLVHGKGRYGINYEDARKYLELSADKNNRNAASELSTIYRDGLGVIKNYEQATRYNELCFKMPEPTRY